MTKDLPNTYSRSTAETAMNPIGQTIPVIHLHFRRLIRTEETERKAESPLRAPRITEQPRRHGSSARYIHDSMTQGYRPGGRCRSCGTMPTKSPRSPGPFSLFLVMPFGRTVITLQTLPPEAHGPRASSVRVSAMEGVMCACA